MIGSSLADADADESQNAVAAPVLLGADDAVAHRFTGQERDGETGLDFFQARSSGAALGRFTSPIRRTRRQLTATAEKQDYRYACLRSRIRWISMASPRSRKKRGDFGCEAGAAAGRLLAAV